MTAAIARIALLVVVGAIVGTLGTLAHHARLGSVRVPLGIVIALAAVLLLFAGVRLVTGSRLAVAAAVVGVAVPVAVFLRPSFSGSVIIEGDAPGNAWVWGAAIAAALVLGFPRLGFERSSRP